VNFKTKETLMMRLRIGFTRTTLLLFAIAVLFVPMLHAGPPMICSPFDIGAAPSLPWGSGGWNAPRTGYDLTRLSADTLALLTPATPVIVRMETLRRATIYASQNPRAAEQLLSALKARAFDADATGHPDALAWFDAGYLAESYKQMAEFRWATHAAPPLDGYRWVQQAIGLRGGDPAMEFAAALIALKTKTRPEAEAHFQKAVAGAPDGSLLATNLITHSSWLGLHATTLAALRTPASAATN
jgi:hypothetical protein